MITPNILLSKKTIIIISSVILLILLYLTKTYFKDTIIVSLGGYTQKETVIKTDTKYIKGKVDTVAVFNNYVTTRGITLNAIPKIIYKYISPVKKEMVDSVKVFNTTIKDSLLEGNINIVNSFTGDLKDVVFTYKPLFPKYIRSVDTLYINNTITNTLTKNKGLIGIGVGVNNRQFISVLGSYTTKSKWSIMYEYGKAYDDTYKLINGETFSFKANDLHSVKIIKHF